MIIEGEANLREDKEGNNNSTEYIDQIKEKIVEYSKLIDKIFDSFSSKEKDSDSIISSSGINIKKLLQLTIQAGLNADTKQLLDNNFTSQIIDLITDARKCYSGNFYTRMYRIKPMFVDYFNCEQNELGITYKYSNSDTGVDVDLRNLGVLSTLIDRRIGDEEIPYKYVIGDAKANAYYNTQNGLDRKSLSIKKLKIVIGDLDLSGYQGEISDDLIVTGNIIFDKETKIDNLRNINSLKVFGKAFGLENIIKEKEDLKGIEIIGDSSEEYDFNEISQKIINWINENSNSKDSNCLEKKDLSSQKLLEIASTVNPRYYETAKAILSEILKQFNKEPE